MRVVSPTELRRPESTQELCDIVYTRGSLVVRISSNCYVVVLRTVEDGPGDSSETQKPQFVV